MSRRGRPRGRELIRTAQRGGQAAYNLGEDISGIGVALAMALSGVVIAVSPGYLGLEWASIAFDAVLSLAIAFWFWSMMGFLVKLGEIRKFISGINEQGWENLLISFVFLIPAGAFYTGVRLLAVPTWVELPMKLASVVLAVLSTLFIAAALDFFFVQPRLKNLAKPGSGANRRPALGSVATAVAWMLANAANALVIIDQLFGGQS